MHFTHTHTHTHTEQPDVDLEAEGGRTGILPAYLLHVCVWKTHHKCLHESSSVTLEKPSLKSQLRGVFSFSVFQVKNF